MGQTALIGFSGFVGNTLCQQNTFDKLYRSTNIDTIDGSKFDTVICAAAPAQKWIANREPEADLKKIEGLINHLKTIQCKMFILISTVDVFKNPMGVDEQTEVEEYDLQAYGLHRRFLEKFVETQFPNHLIIRLPGLVGAGLLKNIIFDFLNDNNLDKIDHRGVFQFYPMSNLWQDIQIALESKLSLLHLTSEPISVGEIATHSFNRIFTRELDAIPARYDMRTHYANIFGKSGFYQYNKQEVLSAVRAYAQSEPKANL